MKKRIKLAIIAGFAVAATAATFIKNTPTAEASSESMSPRSLYIQNCARCHGSDGRAQTALGNAALTRGIHLTAEQAVAERNAEPAYFRSGDGWQEAEVIGA